MAPSPYIFIISICPVDMNKYARFDEIPSMTQRYLRNQNVTDGRTDNVKTVYPPTNTVCGGGGGIIMLSPFYCMFSSIYHILHQRILGGQFKIATLTNQNRLTHKAGSKHTDANLKDVTSFEERPSSGCLDFIATLPARTSCKTARNYCFPIYTPSLHMNMHTCLYTRM